MGHVPLLDLEQANSSDHERNWRRWLHPDPCKVGSLDDGQSEVFVDLIVQELSGNTVVGCGGLQEMLTRVDRIALPRAPHPGRHFVLSFDASSALRSPPATSQSDGVERLLHLSQPSQSSTPPQAAV
ncbi:hypothetical protein VCV18_010146 [Metarhizium anisopliae]